MTIELFRDDGYLKSCSATVIAADARGIQLNQTVFYHKSGGQPGDSGTLTRLDGSRLKIVDTYKERETEEYLHLLEQDSVLPALGEQVTLEIDWDRRHRLMRMHSCMHLLCAIVPAGVTGGSVQDGRARLDFDLPEPPDKIWIETELNRLIKEDHPMHIQWISDDDLQRQPELVRTMSVKPPVGSDRIRLINFEGVDLQPCGGTHVASTAEIGPVRVRKIEKKGKRNRRITIEFNSLYVSEY